MNAKTSDVAIDATWNFSDNPEVTGAVLAAARYVAERRPSTSEEDLYQEGLLYLAVRPQLAVQVPARVYSWTLRHLNETSEQLAKDPAVKAGSVEEWEQDLDSDTANHGMQTDPFDSAGYPRDLVETLLEGMWNGWTVTDDYRPDGDMPRAKPNPSRNGTDMAHRVDMERAWRAAPLTQMNRNALHLTTGWGLTQEAASLGLGVSQQAVSQNVQQGLYLLCLELNGDV